MIKANKWDDSQPRRRDISTPLAHFSARAQIPDKGMDSKCDEEEQKY
jgi:hypothetical protein